MKLLTALLMLMQSAYAHNTLCLEDRNATYCFKEIASISCSTYYNYYFVLINDKRMDVIFWSDLKKKGYKSKRCDACLIEYKKYLKTGLRGPC